MEYFTFARAIHVIAVVLWIGGVGMVTTVVIPAVKRMKPEGDMLKTFAQIEGRFAPQARITTLLTGASGFYMLYALDGWERYLDYRYWWIHAMTLVWLIFSLILFIVEPFVLPKIRHRVAKKSHAQAIAIMHRVHWVLLVLSLIAIFGAVAGSHGWFILK